jgi:hypothetical protein
VLGRSDLVAIAEELHDLTVEGGEGGVGIWQELDVSVFVVMKAACVKMCTGAWDHACCRVVSGEGNVR